MVRCDFKLIDLRTKSKTKEAEGTIALLSDIPKQLIKKLPLRDVAVLMGKAAETQSKQDNVLLKVFKIDGIEYGMHPDLSSLTLGEYADMENFIKSGIEKNMPECMAILFRPIIEKKNNAYTIEAYDGNIKIPDTGFAEKWGWFGVMHRLCNQDISKLESITKINLFECLTWLTYETDLDSQNKVKYDK